MRLFLLLPFLFVIGCRPNHSEIEEQFPKDSKLTFEAFMKAERIMKDSNYYILQINAKHGTDRYEPFLLFYNRKNLKLEEYLYNPGKVLSVKNKTIKGCYNGFRSEKTVGKLENGYDYIFDHNEPAHLRNEFKGSIISYEIKNDSVVLQFKDSVAIKNAKYSVNDIIFAETRRDIIDNYLFTDTMLTYNHYEVSESELKKEIWRKMYLKN